MIKQHQQQKQKKTKKKTDMETRGSDVQNA